MKSFWYIPHLVLALLCPLLLFSTQPLAAQHRVIERTPPTPVIPMPYVRDLTIVGGQPAEPGEWPWQVLVRPGSYLCGGTLIATEWIVTAAHCLFDEKHTLFAPSAIKVTLGEHDRTKTEGTEQLFAIAEVIVHDQYDPWTNNNDIALLRLAVPVNVTPTIYPLALLTADDESTLAAVGTAAMVTGWGTMEEGGNAATTLMEVAVPLVSNAQCNESYGMITANMICAGYETGGKDSCQGDSGGPLVVPDDQGGWRLAGVVSFGNGCARANFYGVYTRLSRFVAWIEAETALALADPTPAATATSGALPTKTPTPNPTMNPTVNPTGTLLPTATPTAPLTPTPTAVPTNIGSHISAVLDPAEEVTVFYESAQGHTISLVIPVGAVTEPVTLLFNGSSVLASQAAAQPVKRLFQLIIYRQNLAQPTFAFQEPVVIALDYAERDLKEFNEDTLMLVVYDFATDSWSTDGLALIEHDREANYLLVTTTRTGLYALGTTEGLLFLPMVQR